MADMSHLEKMGRELKCPICWSLLNSAVSLSCNHVFCNSCIVRSMKSDSTCPVCKVPFRRREVRAAPQMDSLVSIYKRMEIASGINIFVSQTAPSKNPSGEEKQADKQSNCNQQEIGTTFQEVAVNTSNGRAKLNTDLKTTKIVKPSFPTKKRVQVAHYPLPETPVQPPKLDSQSSEPKDMSIPLTTWSLPNRGGEMRLSPFFWLKDDNNEEAALSQKSDGDHSMDTPPPHVPTFSDIQDSDNETPSEIAQGKRNSRHRAEDIFDSEMFEWTQRPCSPELFSTPTEVQVSDDEEIIKVQGEKKVSASQLRRSCAVTDSDESEYFSCEQGTGIRDSQQNNCSQKNDVDVHSQAEIAKNGRKGKKITGQKELKANRYLCDGAHVDMRVSEVDCANTHNGDKPKSEKKSTKRPYKRKSFCKSSSTEPFRLNQEDGSMEIGCPDTSRTVNGISESGTRKNLNEINSQKKLDIVDQSCSKTHAPAKNKTTEEVAAAGTSEKVDNVCQVFTANGKESSELEEYTQKGRRRTRSVTTEAGRALRSTKKLKVSFNEICKDKSHASSVSMIAGKEIQNVEDILGKRRALRSTKKLKVSFNEICKDKSHASSVSMIAGKEIQNVEDILGKPRSSASGSSVVDGKSPLTGGEVVLRKCNSAPEKVHCAFCHSAEESEAYGEMVHYLNGKPIAADHSGGSHVIHSHRNCTEWAPNVYFQDDIAINLKDEIVRSRKIKCSWCGIRGAALGCYKKGCRKSFHVPCAKSKKEFRWDNDNFVILCPFHASLKLPCEVSGPEKISKSNSKPKRQDGNKPGKVAGNVDTTISLNRIALETCNKIVLCCSALSITEKEIVSEFEKLSGVRECKKWNSNVTHVIASTDENGACRRTLKVLMAILEGKWILSVDWIKACIDSKGLVDEQQYEIRVDIHGIQDGPRLGRLRRINQEPKLFHSLRFYLCGDFAPSYKGYLHELITAAGGIILHRKPVLGEHSVNLGASTPSTFVIYSLELPEKCDLSKKNVILNQRRAEAESLAVSTGTTAASNSWLLKSIAASALQNI